MNDRKCKSYQSIEKRGMVRRLIIHIEKEPHLQLILIIDVYAAAMQP